MEFKKQGWVFSQTPIWAACDPNLTNGAHRLLAYLIWRQGTDAGSWPSIKKMATDLYVCRATIKRRLSNLDDCGYIEITKRSGRSSIYSAVADPKNASEKYTPRKKSTPLAELLPHTKLIPHADLTLPLSQKCTDTPCRIEPHDDTHRQESENNMGADAQNALSHSLAGEETSEELQQEQDQYQEQDTSFDAIMGERQSPIPRGDPVQSNGDWATRQSETPWATWGEHSKEAQAQLARRDGMAQSLRRLGYELDTMLGLRPLWKQKRSVASWFAGLANCLAEAEGDVDLVLEAARHLREQEMTISSPHSLVKTTSALAAKRRSGSGVITIGL